MEEKIVWLSPEERPFEISGFAWFEKEKIYRRLPAKSVYKIPEAVSNLADNTAGGVIRFRTDSKTLHIHVKLRQIVNMPHMPATGHSGFDCYIGGVRKEIYISTAIPDVKSREYKKKFFQFDEKKTRSITLYFPLYNGVDEVLIGIEAGARVFSPEKFSFKGRIVVYGTSITQGGCASRPGMCYTNILSRWLGAEFINLGFSGSGKGEPELAHLITMISGVRCIVLDYQANAGIETYVSTLPGFLEILRGRFKNIPIIIISRPAVSMWAFDSKSKDAWMKGYKFQEELVNRIRKLGDKNIFSFCGYKLFKKMWQESTVDGGHPTDLGFFTMTNGLYPILKKVLK